LTHEPRTDSTTREFDSGDHFRVRHPKAAGARKRLKRRLGPMLFCADGHAAWDTEGLMGKKWQSVS